MTEPEIPDFLLPLPIMPSEENTFAHYTIVCRLPGVIERVIKDNNFPPTIVQQLESLVTDIFEGSVRPLAEIEAPDLIAWESYLKPFEGKSWFDLPFYFAEAYFFRRLLEATNYFVPGILQGIDPFGYQKRSSLEKSMDAIRVISDNASVAGQYRPRVSQQDPFTALLQQSYQTSITTLLQTVLWGNQIDLSLWSARGGDRTNRNLHQQQTQILVDDTYDLLNYLSNIHGQRIDLIIDNASFELVCDFFLIDFLLSTQTANTVYLHLKAHPSFVSDAINQDVFYTLEKLANDTSENVRMLATRLQEYIASSRLICRENFFWNAPLAFWEMPESLRKELAKASLVFIKGDANYRRLLGDRHWLFTTLLSDIANYFPTPFVALRTLKSEVATNLEPDQIEILNEQDPLWLTNSQWGVIQFVRPE
ncbi:MAG: protein-glutamate O-methyltransferase family protein [Okeania sp. SIO3I5]|uniref:damage-control phosphatase ARMT1 family protein n=1 Tax=Okeania sp. SIO3I5 TaxID=2607805 RepID=UPI0013BC0347|nr:damage-control phosphatase ARMT1 family protein [Okeania sp. SIO3I5]NEQ41471.1 protein-glutamate O-methyltransferase family protein [Okeania sp. SIO3I5]